MFHALAFSLVLSPSLYTSFSLYFPCLSFSFFLSHSLLCPEYLHLTQLLFSISSFSPDGRHSSKGAGFFKSLIADRDKKHQWNIL